MFNETVLSRMQNIITFKMIGKSTKDDSFQYLRTQVIRVTLSDNLRHQWWYPFYELVQCVPQGTWPTERSWLYI